MNPIQVIITAVIMLPKIVSLVGAVMDLMEEGVDWAEIAKRLDQMVKDLAVAKDTGDTSGIEDDFHNATRN